MSHRLFIGDVAHGQFGGSLGPLCESRIRLVSEPEQRWGELLRDVEREDSMLTSNKYHYMILHVYTVDCDYAKTPS
jgi:hypothetical protein